MFLGESIDIEEKKLTAIGNFYPDDIINKLKKVLARRDIGNKIFQGLVGALQRLQVYNGVMGAI